MGGKVRHSFPSDYRLALQAAQGGGVDLGGRYDQALDRQLNTDLRQRETQPVARAVGETGGDIFDSCSCTAPDGSSYGLAFLWCLHSEPCSPFCCRLKAKRSNLMP